MSRTQMPPYATKISVLAREVCSSSDRANAHLLLDMLALALTGRYCQLGKPYLALDGAYQERLGPPPSCSEEDRLARV